MFRGAIAMAAVAAILLYAGTTAQARVLDAYAAPNTWGPSYALDAHLGRVTYMIGYTALGKTAVVGEVTYIGPNGRQVTQQFNGSIQFRTGNAVARPTVRFKGIPFGSAVRVTTSP